MNHLEDLVHEKNAELLKANEQLIRAERLAATGQLAASIAHEINSPLQAITIILSMLKDKYKDDNGLIDNLDIVKEAIGNIKNTVKKLLELTPPVEEKKKKTNINKIIKNTLSILKNYLKAKNIKVNLNLSLAIPDIISSRRLLQHVFINLINNSVDAMSGSYGSSMVDNKVTKIISIKTELKEDKIIIAISDTGPGIPEPEMKYIFDPFYTKKKKIGMGIGLPICYSIIKDHKGNIEAKHSCDKGAVFIITLPLINN
jgi:signal transduction histidine kinase